MNFFECDGNQFRLDKITGISKVYKSENRNPYAKNPVTIVSYYFITYSGRWKFETRKDSEDEVENIRSSLLRALCIDDYRVVKPTKGESISGYRKLDDPTTNPTGNPIPNL